MSPAIRHLESAIDLAINGTLRADDSPQAINEVLAALIRIASDWAEVAMSDDNCLATTRGLIVAHNLEP